MAHKFTPAHCLALSRKAKLRRHTPETKQKISSSLVGHVISPATKQKMRAKALYRKNQFNKILKHMKTKHPEEVTISLNFHKTYTYCLVCAEKV